MNRISLKGVAIGNIADIVATYVVMLPLIIYIVVSSGLPPAEILKESTVFYVSYAILGGICSVLGGYVSARIAKHDELLNGALSSILCVGGGMYAGSAAARGRFMAASRFPAAEPRAGGPRRLPARAATCAARLIKSK
jgi:hypothetical protein